MNGLIPHTWQQPPWLFNLYTFNRLSKYLLHTHDKYPPFKVQYCFRSGTFIVYFGPGFSCQNWWGWKHTPRKVLWFQQNGSCGPNAPSDHFVRSWPSKMTHIASVLNYSSTTAAALVCRDTCSSGMITSHLTWHAIMTAWGKGSSAWRLGLDSL